MSTCTRQMVPPSWEHCVTLVGQQATPTTRGHLGTARCRQGPLQELPADVTLSRSLLCKEQLLAGLRPPCHPKATCQHYLLRRFSAPLLLDNGKAKWTKRGSKESTLDRDNDTNTTPGCQRG